MPYQLDDRTRHLQKRWLAAAEDVQPSLTRLALALKAGFDPNEPRVPAGNPDGGRWTRANETRIAQYSIGTLIAEIPIPGGRYCVYKFDFGTYSVPGPINFRCPQRVPSAAVTHGSRLNDN